ncbi:uncharacterized protein [Palaemon carinicauda]|uniref:uncharacterized protein n=1 Tax=Palaemon carinicauda TaxID=392227 RepID=UPI0035B61AB2
MSREPHSNVTEFPLKNFSTTIISTQIEEKGFHPTTQTAEHGSVPLPHNNISQELVPLINHTDSSLPKSSSEDIWTSLYQEWLSVSQSNSSKSSIETSAVASLDKSPTRVMTNISTLLPYQQTTEYMITSGQTSDKPNEDTTYDKTVSGITGPNTSPSNVAGSNIIETTTEIEFGDVLGSLWDLNAKEVLQPEKNSAVKFPPVRMPISQLPTAIPLYTIDNLTTTSSPSSSSTTDRFSAMVYSVHNKGYSIKDKLMSPFSIEQSESSHLSSGNKTNNAVTSLIHSSDGDILIHSSSEDIPKTGGTVKGEEILPTGQSEAGKNHALAISPIRSFVNKVTDQILSLPKLFTGSQNEKKVIANPGSQTFSTPENLVTAPGRRPFYNGKLSKPTSFVPSGIHSSAVTTSAIPSQIYYPFANESKVNQHPLLGNHRQYHTHEISTSTNRPVIIVKKKGSRIHIPVMPSADFSSFKSHKQTLHSTQPSSDNPVMDVEPGNRFARPPVFSGTTRNILTTRLPVRNSNRHKPSVSIESRNRYIATSTPSLPLFTKTATLNDRGLGAAHTTPSLRRKGCGSNLLDRLEYLLGRELVMDQMGVGVYSAVVESILAVECDLPSRTPPGISSDMTGTISSTYTDQISPPLPTSSISPTLGMDGWLSLDDIRKDEEEKLSLKTTSSPTDGLVTNNQLPSDDSLSPIAAFLSAMPSPVPVHTTTESSVNSSTSLSSLAFHETPTSNTNPLMAIETRINSSSMVSSPSSLANTDIAIARNDSPVSSNLDVVPSFNSSPETSLLQSSNISSLLPENSTAEVQATSAMRRSFLHDGHKKLMRRAVGMAALNSLALAKAMPLENEDEGSHLTVSSRELTTNIFGFETILTALVYLSFGIFLYQMIQRAVGAKIMGLPLDNFITNGGRSFSVDGSRVFNEEPIDSYNTLLFQALRKVPNIASKILLEEGKTLEVQAKSPSCLPLYLCRVTSQRYHQRDHENVTESEHSSMFHHALLTSAVSTLVSTWSGQNPSELLMATFTGALGLPCIFEEATCSDKL